MTTDSASEYSNYLEEFISKFNVYANIDKLFVKKVYDIKRFLEKTIQGLDPLTLSVNKIEYDHLMVEKGYYYISLIHDDFEIKIPAPVDGVFIVDGIEKVIISQEIFCTPCFVYKDHSIEYKECNKYGKFQSMEMFTNHKYVEYLKKVIGNQDRESISNLSNEHTNVDIYYTFSSKDRHKKLSLVKRHIYLDIRIYFSQFFQLLRIKGIKSHEKQSISLLYILHYLDPTLSLTELRNMIISIVIGKNIPDNIDIVIPNSFPEETLASIIARRKEGKEEIIKVVHKIIDNYFTPDSLHLSDDTMSSYDNNNSKRNKTGSTNKKYNRSNRNNNNDTNASNNTNDSNNINNNNDNNNSNTINNSITNDDSNNDHKNKDYSKVKFFTYLTMARALFHGDGKEHYNSRIDTFPCSMFRFIKYFTLENKHLPLNKFVHNLNFKLYSNVKSGIVRSYFRDYSAIAVQTLSKRSYYDKLSHLRRVQIPINTESENSELRMSYEYGYFCPFETPESKDVGLVKYFGLSVLIAPDFTMNKNLLNSVIYKEFGKEENEIGNENKNRKEYPVLLNTRFIGFTSKDLVDYTYKELKLEYPFISCIFDEVAYYLFTDEGRMVRPLKVLKNKELIGIRFIDIAEFKCNKDYTYEELDPNFVFGLISALSPFPGNNHVPRLTFQAGMTKQCMSNDSTIFKYNDNSRKLVHAQKPFCMTRLEHFLSRRICHYESLNIILENMQKEEKEKGTKEKPENDNNLYKILFPNFEINHPSSNLNLNQNIWNNKSSHSNNKNIKLNNAEFRKRLSDLSEINIEKDESVLITEGNTYHRFGGQNAIVAIMAFGNNQEDSVIFNANSIEQGLFQNIKYRYQYISYNIKDEILININSNYENGLPKPNTEIACNPHFVNEPIFRKYNYVKNEITDIENIFRKPVCVDHCTTFVKDDICYCCVEVRHIYKPQQGDKFASRYAQKGVIGSIMLEELLPRTEHGIIPDIIVNPHAFPSRMTVGHLIEMYVGKCMVMDPCQFGTFFDASIESEDLKSFKEKYLESDIPVNETMIDPITGKTIGTAFVGVCYYTALQHQVEEKMFYRIMGNVNSISKQPTEGKSHNGGLRIGEMEKDALVAHSANAILQDMFRNNTDGMDIRYCTKCHSLSTFDECCHTPTESLTVSNSFNIMNAYLESINIHTTIYE